MPWLRPAQGGTAVGTGLRAETSVRTRSSPNSYDGKPFAPAPNLFEALAFNDPLVHSSATLATSAVALTKIANDIRLLGSGPRAGLSEMSLPANEPSSSIMPGKVDPTLAEMVTMVCAQVIGNRQGVTVARMQGHLEFNVFKPMIGAAVIRSVDLLATAMSGFAERCIDRLAAYEQRLLLWRHHRSCW